MKPTSPKISVVIIGFGYWGKTLARVVSGIPEMNIVGVIDPYVVHPMVNIEGHHVPVLRDMDRMLKDIHVGAVMISSPAQSHFTIARKALLYNKHVFIEKPMTLSSRDAKTLVALAQKNKCVFLVDHTYIYSDVIMQMKQMMDRGDIGSVYAMESMRMNWGTIRDDCSVIWDLAAHDVSIYRYFFGQPTKVRATGFQYGGAALANQARVYLENAHGITGTCDVSWVYPKKIRSVIVVGSKGFLVMDETEAKGKIHIYRNGHGRETVVSDDVHKEPLRRACEDFAACIQKGSMPRVSGQDGVAVVSVLTAADRSLLGTQGWRKL